MAFRTTLKIRFGHEDHAGIVYFPRFLHFFHCAFEDFFDAQGHPYKQVLDEAGFGWPAVHLDVDFQSPLRFGDRFDIDVWVEELGTKSATFAYRGSVAGRLVATARITVACIDMQRFRGVPIPEVYRALFERFREPPAPLDGWSAS
ncbi:MAG TPA: thioesterase family protein [Polyangiaceae bacterium LLY-WYZ-15_(1-7)]|nr:thioesterase family protein [Polyangiaceae bacterium LLY-WYZ-15_(1-7)]